MIFTNLIETNLRTKIFGQNIEYYQRLDSTNKEAWELIDSNEAHHGMVIITDNQLAGKGRNGNSWFMSPSKGLALSIILTKKIPLDKAKLIPIGASVSIAKALKNRGCSPELKWPNDILLDGKKCGGILCESRIFEGFVKYMVIGIGLNVNENVNDLPSSLNNQATSYAIETGNSIQRELVCAIILTYLEQIIENLETCIQEWLKFCSHMEKSVKFRLNKKTHEGIFKGLNKDGEALIKINNELVAFPSIIIE